MKYLKRQEGVVLPLAILLVAVVAVVVGVAVWHSQKAKTNHATSSPTPTSVAQASSTPTATPSPANEIKVTELGFKMTLPAGLTGLKYVPHTNGNTQQPATYSSASFSTTSLEESDARCTAGDASIGSIVRYSENPTTFGSVTKVGNFYLVFTTPQQSCSDKAAAEQLQTSQTSLLRQALATATAL
jgi:hypothetical protein